MSRSTNIIFDFDCTLTALHLYHTMHSGDMYLRHLEKTISTSHEWDTRSMCVVNHIQLNTDDTGEYGHIPGLLDSTPCFTNYMFGGTLRVQALQKVLKQLKTVALLHISTKGIISDVIVMLRNIGVLHYFHYIEGMSDDYMLKMVYYVGKGFMKNNNTFFTQCIGLDDLHHFADKPSFIGSLITPFNHSVYLDDDSEYYDELHLAFPGRISTIDIGVKEGIYTTGKQNFGIQEMTMLLECVQRMIHI
jgi:hypothetical protein